MNHTASKFGISPNISFQSEDKLERDTPEGSTELYILRYILFFSPSSSKEKSGNQSLTRASKKVNRSNNNTPCGVHTRRSQAIIV